MAKNTGIPYELIAQAIFQTIHDAEDVGTVKVEHNKKIKGKFLTHQIDVYWKLKKGGITHTVVVQVKDWKDPRGGSVG